MGNLPPTAHPTAAPLAVAAPATSAEALCRAIQGHTQQTAQVVTDGTEARRTVTVMNHQDPVHDYAPPHPRLARADAHPDVIIRTPTATVLRTTNPDTYATVTDITAIAAPTPTIARHRWHTPSIDNKRRMAITPATRHLGWHPGDTLRLEWHALDTFTLTRTANHGPDSVLIDHVTIDANNRITLTHGTISNLGLGPDDRPLIGIPKATDGNPAVTVVGPGAFERLTFGTHILKAEGSPR